LSTLATIASSRFSKTKQYKSSEIILYMKILLLALLFQPIDTIPPIEELFLCLEEYNRQSLVAELSEYQESTKGEWLKYVPNLGFGYTIGTKEIEGETKLVGKLRPSVSLNTGIIYTAHKDKKLRKAKREAIKKVHILNLSGYKSNIVELIGNYQNAKESLNLAYRIHDIDTKLYQIDSTMHTNLEMAPSDWLKVQRAYLLKSYELVEKNRDLARMKNEILRLAKCE